MKKKILSAGIAAALTMSLMASTPAVAGKKVLLKVPVWFGTHLTGLGSTPKYVAEHLNAASGGSVKMKIYEPGKLVPPKEILESVSKGQVNAGWSTPCVRIEVR